MKKWLLPALIVVIVVQLLIPAYRIAHKYDILSTGEEYRFKVNPIDPYDAFRGRYVSLYSRLDVSGEGRYGVITVDADGFARISSVSDERPVSDAYVKSSDRSWYRLPIDRYYMDEKSAPLAETITQQRAQDEEAYVTVRIKNGELVITGLFVDGIPIESLIREELSAN